MASHFLRPIGRHPFEVAASNRRIVPVKGFGDFDGETNLPSPECVEVSMMQDFSA